MEHFEVRNRGKGQRGGERGAGAARRAPGGLSKLNEKNKNFNTISHVLGNISSKESLTLDRVYKKLIESLIELNDKNEDYIISELNSFHREENL